MEAVAQHTRAQKAPCNVQCSLTLAGSKQIICLDGECDQMIRQELLMVGRRADLKVKGLMSTSPT